MSDITGSPHWACSEKCKQKNLVTEKSVSTVCQRIFSCCPLPGKPGSPIDQEDPICA